MTLAFQCQVLLTPKCTRKLIPLHGRPSKRHRPTHWPAASAKNKHVYCFPSQWQMPNSYFCLFQKSKKVGGEGGHLLRKTCTYLFCTHEKSQCIHSYHNYSTPDVHSNGFPSFQIFWHNSLGFFFFSAQSFFQRLLFMKEMAFSFRIKVILVKVLQGNGTNR